MTKYLFTALFVGAIFMSLLGSRIQDRSAKDTTIVCNEITSVPAWGRLLSTDKREVVVNGGYVISIPTSWAILKPNVGEKYKFTYRYGVLSFIEQTPGCH